MHINSNVLARVPGLKHGFGTRGEIVPSSLEPEWSQAHPSWKQVHGIDFVEITAPLQKCGETDGQLSLTPRLPVACVTADCVPVLLARKSGGAGAAIHAGWRGTFAGAVEAVWKELERRGELLSNWVAAIGPAIGPCCYEVSEELISDFKTKFGAMKPALIEPSYRRLDLPAIHEARLKDAGFGEVELIRACTFCSGSPDNPTFHSYRREKNSNRQYSGLVFESQSSPW
jgi:YfiH family protein